MPLIDPRETKNSLPFDIILKPGSFSSNLAMSIDKKLCPDFPFCPNKPYCQCFQNFESDQTDYMTIFLKGGYKFISKTSKAKKNQNSLNTYLNKNQKGSRYEDRSSSRASNSSNSSALSTLRTPKNHGIDEVKLPL